MDKDFQLRKGQPDFMIMVISLLLLGIGLVMIYSSSQIAAYDKFNDSSFFFKRQVVWAIAGIIAMIMVMNIPYTVYKKLTPLIILTLFILMVLVLTGLGSTVNGAQRWLDLGFTKIQPSEFVKLGIIIYLASIYSKKQEHINNFSRGLIPPLVVVAIFFMLILLQRDLGTGMSVIFFTMVMIFCSGAQFKHLFGLGLVCSVIFFIFARTSPYRWQRITSFKDPWAEPLGSGYQLIQSLYAIGNGGVFGNGFGKSIQKYHYLPEAHTDFIFSITAEELGLVGVLVILSLYLFFVLRGITISNRCPDLFGKLLAIGIVAMIGIQALINIAVVSGTLPVTGITLPFLSYGGSSLLLTMVAVGMLLNISRYSHYEPD
ncbi:putative lipid II flippase FtsW [Caldalkalibacillus mannanilyticus]|uniref:putative lipid II flippase FtsW n=1 Tax=Caldalkalibacillus mannanilyticus TaxID=1418 RepID=UPI000468E9BD|nr:putative lipid II flippase FtsW [Caldalkalibacillus mannanilyticus]